MTTLALEPPFAQDAPSPGAAAVATRTPFGTGPSGSEAFRDPAQSLIHTGSFGWSVASGELHWSAETYNIFGHDRAVKPELEMALRRIHPDDRDLVQQTPGDEVMRFQTLRTGVVEFLLRPLDDEILGESVQELSTIESRREIHDGGGGAPWGHPKVLTELTKNLDRAVLSNSLVTALG